MEDLDHKKTAIEYHSKFWTYFEKEELSRLEELEMLHAAIESLDHWMAFSGHTIVNAQRGEYLVAKCYLRLGDQWQASRYAQLVLDKTLAHPEMMKDFDVAYAYELMGKVSRLNGQEEQASEYLQKAREAGNALANEKDKEYFMADLERAV